MTTSVTYLITGANRGVGRAIADRLLARPNTRTTLIALVRDPSNETSQSLLSQSKDNTTNSVILLPYDAANLDAAEKALSQLRTSHPAISSIDVVLANAGASGYFGASLDASPETYVEHFTANAVGPLQLFRAVEPFLSKAATSSANDSSSTRPAFIAVSSAVGSTQMANAGTLSRDTKGGKRRGALPYGASKAALNHIVCKLAGEYPDVTFGILTPGPTRTGFGGPSVNYDLVPGAQDVDTVADGLVKRIDEIRSKKGGEQVEFRDWKGDVFPW